MVISDDGILIGTQPLLITAVINLLDEWFQRQITFRCHRFLKQVGPRQQYRFTLATDVESIAADLMLIIRLDKPLLIRSEHPGSQGLRTFKGTD